MDAIARHYGRTGLVGSVLQAVEQAGGDPQHPTTDDLAGADEFHVRGREGSAALAELARPQSGERVLDVGCGIGGSSRYLAETFGCSVTGIDLTPEYCDAAAELSAIVGLSDQTVFHCTSALDMPFDEGVFDLAWTQHVQMNIADKAAFYREIARVLKPGGRLALHDLFAGLGGPSYFPVPWASEPEQSFLQTQKQVQAAVVAGGLRIVEWRDVTAVSRDWFLGKIDAAAADGPAPVGLHLLMGETGGLKFENVARNFREERIEVGMAVCAVD